jgi:hypothetical protein
VKPRTPTSFTLIAQPHPVDGKPVVVIDFGRFGRIAMDADDVDRFIAALEAKLRESRAMGTT